MGCIANQNVPEEKIPLSIVGPILLIAGAIGLFVDYLNIGTHSTWWYSAAIVVGLIVSVRGARDWKKPVEKEPSEK